MSTHHPQFRSSRKKSTIFLPPPLYHQRAAHACPHPSLENAADNYTNKHSFHRASCSPPTLKHSGPKTCQRSQLSCIINKLWHTGPRINVLQILDASLREFFMEFQLGATAAPGLSESKRCYILGQPSDFNIIFWLFNQSTLYTHNINPTHFTPHTKLPFVAATLQLLRRQYNPTSEQNSIYPPHPIIWQPRHNPTEWIYRDGPLIEDKLRIGASVIPSPTSTTTYIDASGQDETRTIMRTELIAIYLALDK